MFFRIIIRSHFDIIKIWIRLFWKGKNKNNNIFWIFFVIFMMILSAKEILYKIYMVLVLLL